MAVLMTRLGLLTLVELNSKNHLFVLGKGYAEPIAMEGALKIKEMCYLHAEGYSGGALKHGPFALIEGKEGSEGSTPVITIILDDEHASHMRTAAEEVCHIFTTACFCIMSLTCVCIIISIFVSVYIL